MSAVVVTVAAAADRPAAVQLLRGDGPDPRQLGAWLQSLEAAAGAEVLVARGASGEVVGAAVVQALPGSLGVLWPPRGASPAITAAVAAAGSEWLRQHGVTVAQAFVTEAAADRAALEQVGFRPVTHLLTLRRELNTSPSDSPSGPLREAGAEQLHVVPYQADRAEHFAALLLATHEGTQDCPELTGTRTPAEVVAGFNAPFDSAGWQVLATATGELVGLTLVQVDADGQLELSYLGVVPRWRQRGLGGRLLRRVLAQAERAGFPAVQLSVDERNGPARRLYQRHGFRELRRYEVWLAHFPRSSR